MSTSIENETAKKILNLHSIVIFGTLYNSEKKNKRR